MKPIKPTAPAIDLTTKMVALSLSVADLNMVLEALGELPAKKSHRIINTMQLQAMQQLNQPPPKTEADKENLSRAEKKRQRKALKLAGGTEAPGKG